MLCLEVNVDGEYAILLDHCLQDTETLPLSCWDFSRKETLRSRHTIKDKMTGQ
jgi:hypothetical protein